MKPIKHTNISEPIVSIKILNDKTIVVVDKNTTVRYYDKEDFSLKNGFKAKITHQRYKTKVVEFSNDGEHFAVLSADCRESRLYNTKTKKMRAKVGRHQGEVSCVGIEPNGRYMFSCGDDGKTFVVDIKSGKLAFTLPPHADTINDIVFTKNSQWIATASYDRKVSIYNLAMMTPKHKIKVGSAPVMKVCFLTKHRFFCVDNRSSGSVFDIYSGKALKRLQGIHDDVRSAVSTADGQFLFLGTNLGYVLVYELENYELLARSYIKLKTAVACLEFDEEYQTLILGTESGDIYFYDIYDGVHDLKNYLQTKRYALIEKKLEENPILAYTKVYNMLESIWEKTFEQAKKLLESGQKQKAMAVLKGFTEIPSKNSLIQRVLKDYGEFEKFANFVREGKLPLAYSMVQTHPLYKETRLYKQIEEQWKKTFLAARKYALDPRGMDRAKEILKPYRGVSEKTKFIQELMTEGEVYKRFKNAMGKKDFKLVFDLVKKYPFLREFPEYDTLINYADSLYIKAQKLIQAGETVGALKFLRILRSFSGYEDEVEALMKEIENKKEFFDAVENEDMATAYNILDENEELQDTPAGRKLQEKWQADLDLAGTYASACDIEGVKQTLEPYMKISSKYMAIATVFSWCYMMQLEQAIREKRSRQDIEHGIKNHILAFGLQDQIVSFFNIFKKYYPDTKLNIELQPKGSLKMWRPSMIVDSILD